MLFSVSWFQSSWLFVSHEHMDYNCAPMKADSLNGYCSSPDITIFHLPLTHRSSLPQELHVCGQNHPEASVQGLCSHLPPAFWLCDAAAGGSSSQHLLQAFHFLCSGDYPTTRPHPDVELISILSDPITSGRLEVQFRMCNECVLRSDHSDHFRKCSGMWQTFSSMCEHIYATRERSPTPMTSSDLLQFHIESNRSHWIKLVRDHTLICLWSAPWYSHQLMIHTFLKLVKSFFIAAVHSYNDRTHL